MNSGGINSSVSMFMWYNQPQNKTVWGWKQLAGQRSPVCSLGNVVSCLGKTCKVVNRKGWTAGNNVIIRSCEVISNNTSLTPKLICPGMLVSRISSAYDSFLSFNRNSQLYLTFNSAHVSNDAPLTQWKYPHRSLLQRYLCCKRVNLNFKKETSVSVLRPEAEWLPLQNLILENSIADADLTHQLMRKLTDKTNWLQITPLRYL